jgi:hypothetical protein
MAKKIGEYAVHLTDETGTLHSFLPGDEVPAWAEKRMGDHCFEGGGDEFDEDGQHPAAGGGGDVPLPPQSGRGSSTDKWAAYAESNGVDVEGLDRDEIIAACEEAGVAVE